MNTQIDVFKFTSIEQIKGYNAAIGHHFFSPDAIRFFGSRVYDEVVIIENQGAAFITSERDEYIDQERRYTVRIQRPDGTIDEVSQFQEFPTLRQARAYLAKYQKFHQHLP